MEYALGQTGAYTSLGGEVFYFNIAGRVAMRNETKAESLIGETLTHIDESPDQIMLTTESGRVIRISHDQDCCEHVTIESTDGQWVRLIGKVIEEASHEEIERGDPVPHCPESWTRTAFTFKTRDDTVISRWIGESNGYYSESVTLHELEEKKWGDSY